LTWLKNVFGTQGRNINLSTTLPSYAYKARVVNIGSIGAGKSTINSGLVLTAEKKSIDDSNFYCRVLPNNTSILYDVSNLRQGYFPKKTPAFQINPPEAGLLVGFGGLLGDKKVQVPLADYAGEDNLRMLHKVQNVQRLDGESWNAAIQAINYIQDADAFIVSAPASRALLFENELQLEREAVLDPNSPDAIVDPDNILHEMLSKIITHKDVSHTKAIKGIALVITKWDLMMPYASKLGMDVYDPSGKGLQDFMNAAFPGTMMELKAVGISKVEFFPSYFMVKRNEDGSIYRDGQGREIILPMPGRVRTPYYSEGSYMRLFDWLKGFAVA
jgi:hypothetical protein